jgi:hypothetical protein
MNIIWTIVFIYFGCGLFVGTGTFLVITLTDKKVSWQSLVSLFFIIPIWPVYAKAIQQRAFKRTECAFCGEKGPANDAYFRRHVLLCKKHPFRQLYLAAVKTVGAYEDEETDLDSAVRELNGSLNEIQTIIVYSEKEMKKQ